ncbi:DUF3372 domain-containing protein [Vibrio chagasii]|nr:DUF3372 domain-containing protein [Vibrio chagasii]
MKQSISVTLANQVEGLIVMSIDDGVSAGTELDPANDAIVAIVNSTNNHSKSPGDRLLRFTSSTKLSG